MLSNAAPQTPDTATPPWYAYPEANLGERHAVIIGAGLAGCSSAASLAARGWRVTVLERHGAIAQEASGNLQGILYLKLSAHGTALSQLVEAGFAYTRKLLEQLQRGDDWDACGVLQLAFNDKEAKRQAQLASAFPTQLLTALNREQAEQIAGIELSCGGLYYPEAGWVYPPALCAHWMQHPNITLHPFNEALSLQREGETWQIIGASQVLAEAPVVILACAEQIGVLAPQALLPLKRIRGQITVLPATEATRALKTVVCADGYIAPPRGKQHTLGASFDFNRQDTELSTAEHVSNLDYLKEISTDLAERFDADALDPATLAGRAAFRCTTPDYLPLVGPVADAQAFAEHYAVLGKDARQVPETPCPWLKGLYVNSGHGSRGLITAPLSGELLAAWINHEALPLPADVAFACHPNRFILRQVIRGA